MKTQQAQSEIIEQVQNATSEIGLDFGAIQSDMDEMASLSDTLQSISQGPDEFEIAMSQIEANDEVDAEIQRAEALKQAKEQRIQSQKEQATRKKLDQFFETTTPTGKSPMHLPEKAEEKRKQKDKISRFFEQEQPKDTPQNFDDFFDTPPSSETDPAKGFFDEKNTSSDQDTKPTKDNWKDFFKD